MFWIHGPDPAYTTACSLCLHYGEPRFNEIERKWFHFQSYGAIGGPPAIKFECRASELRRLDSGLFLPTLAYSVDVPGD
jgi:hypothetical protein